MEPSFNIQTGDTDAANLQLLAEAGPQGLAVVAADMDSQTVTHCMAWHFAPGLDADAAAEQLATLFATAPLLQQGYQKSSILYSFAESILTPHELYHSVDGPTMLQQVYGDAHEGIVRTDFVDRHNLHNMYRLPMAAARLSLQGKSVANSHQYSALLNNFTGTGHALWAIFYPHSVTVLLRKDGALQMVQQYAYTVPEDAAWYLLAVCEQFGVPVAKVPLTLYGTIDPQSALYTELYKYFLHLSFADQPAGLSWPPALQKHPSHFFSHLFAALLCV